MADDLDVFIFYYDLKLYSPDVIKMFVDDIKKALAPRPVIALPKDLEIQRMSREAFITIVDQMLKGMFEPINSEGSMKNYNDAEDHASWEFYAGWQGGGGMRQAACSKCGYVHDPVSDDSELPSCCPQCGRKISVKEVSE